MYEYERLVVEIGTEKVMKLEAVVKLQQRCYEATIVGAP